MNVVERVLGGEVFASLIAKAGQLFSAVAGTFGSGSATFGLAGNISSQSSAAGVGNTNDTNEDLLFTFSLPAASLDQAGRQLQIEAWGTFANNAHSKNVKLYFGSETVAITANVTTGGIGWYLSALVTKTGSNTQSVVGQLIAGTTHGGVTVQAGAETDTAAITVKVTGQTGTAAANDVLCNGMTVTALN